MSQVVLLTGSELRHDYVRKALALEPGVDLVRTYCESSDKSLNALVAEKTKSMSTPTSRHLVDRTRSEIDFFGAFCEYCPDYSNPRHVVKEAINRTDIVDEIAHLNPDVILAYGCSIVRSHLLRRFNRRFLNFHLGLSPYYRGAGTNFWPFVNGEPEYVGATIMHIDEGIDTGEIIHQVRATIYPRDCFHSIGNRLISHIPRLYGQIVRSFQDLRVMRQPAVPSKVRVYKNKDFDDSAVETLYDRLSKGMLEDYTMSFVERTKACPIVENPGLAGRRSAS